MALTSIQMMHLSDSALPIGGFAFSNGLEAAAKSGMVTSQEGLEAYLETALEQWAAFEAPFLRRFYAGFSEDDLLKYDRMMLSPSMQKASFAQGRGWIRVFSNLFPEADIQPLRSRLRELGLGPHFLPLLAASLKNVGATLEQARDLYLFTLLRDQASAAIRLGLTGPAAAQALQSRLEIKIGTMLEKKPPAAPERFTPLMDLAQMLQPTLYTKLFQN